MKLWGDYLRNGCPVCDGSSIERGAWKIPLKPLDNLGQVGGVSLPYAATLDAPLLFQFDQCKACGSVFGNPIPRFQAHTAADAARHAEINAVESYRFRFAQFRQHYPIQHGAFLDAACGAGEFLDLAASEDGSRWTRLIGIDLCQAYVDNIRAGAWRHKGIVADLDEADVGNLIGGPVAFCVLNEAFEHLKHPAQVVDKLTAVLSPNGRIFFSAQLLGSELPIRPSESVYVTNRGLDLVLSRAGLTLVKRWDQCGRALVVAEKLTTTS